jgi:endonuclease YncB( thermonuclease family)
LWRCSARLRPLERRSSRRADRSPRIAYVVDGDTVDLTNGARVRFVQIDTPEVYNSPECHGK